MSDFWLPEGLGKYVFLASLSTGSVKERELAKIVSKELIFENDLSKNNTDFYEKISSVIKILQQIADNEEKKEKQAIETYRQKLINFINNENTPQPIKKDLQEQLNQLNNYSNGINETDIFFIKNINILEQNIGSFKRRLQNLHHLPDNPQDVFNRLEYRLETDLDGFLRDFGSRASRKSTKKNKIIKEALAPLINNELKGKFNDIPGLEQALYGLLYIDFAEKIQNNDNILISEIDEKALINKLDSYVSINQTTNQASNLNQILQNNTTEALNLAQDLISFLGVEFISNSTYKRLKDIQNQIKKIKSEEKNKDKRKAIKDLLGKTHTEKEINERILTYNDQIVQNNKKRFTFTFQTKQSHGFLQEIVRTITKGGINVSRNIATDTIIPVGTCTFSQNEQQEQKELMSVSRDLNNILISNFDKIQQNPITIKNFADAVEDEKQINQQIKDTLDQSSKNLNDIKNNLTDSFISYESLKLYRSYETKTMQSNEFHGRKIQVLSALTKLYAAPGFSEALMNPDMLITFLLNISDSTLGANNKNALEVYLSLFAGTLMFDDISSIATEALANFAQEIPTNSSIKQLHVFNINGIYFPLSIILKNIINQTQLAIQNLSSLALNTEKTAVVKLSAPKTINSVNSPTKEDWENLSQSTIQNTQIQITFLAGFTNYISELYDAMQSI